MSLRFTTSLVIAAAAFVSASTGVVARAQGASALGASALGASAESIETTDTTDTIGTTEASLPEGIPASIPAPASDPVAASALGRIALECPPNPVASAIDGSSVDATEVSAPEHAAPLRDGRDARDARDAAGRPTVPLGLAGSWCRDANDPQCAPLSPTPNAPSWGPGESLPRWVNASFQLAPPASGRDDRAGCLLAPTADFRLPRGQGSSGFARSLERPPRAA